MAKPGSKRRCTASDPGASSDDDDGTSSNNSVQSSPAKISVEGADRILEKESLLPDKVVTFPINFVDLFKEKSAPTGDGSCHFLKPSDAEILEVDEADVDKVEDLWGFCLLGCFASRFPGLKAVRNMVVTWKVDCEILPHQSGWVIFRFSNKDDLEKILAEDPYFIYGRTLLLRSLPENFCFQEEDYSIVPTWVQLHNLPLQCWNTRAISRIASKLGKPLCVDNMMLERKRISFARVPIEMDTSVKPLEQFDVKFPSGVIYTQYVHYENMPKFCNHCYLFGHLRENYRYINTPSTSGTETHGGKTKVQSEKMNINPTDEGSNPADNPSPGQVTETANSDQWIREGSQLVETT